ncbi:MAG TPA: DNA-processing protein DprA [Aquabacterium sp.]|nr:DNA-processing protein DprA [Aquabacterium sp.]
MDRDELSAWLRLVLTPRIGPGTARQLLAALASPQAIFEATSPTLLSIVPAREAKALASVPEGLDEQVDQTLAWLNDEQTGEPADSPIERALLTLADPRYPPSLFQTADPPLLLFAQGRLDLLTRPAVAVVGSRSPTEQGKDNAYAFAKALSQAGVTVVSGLAQGVDGAAHEGALDAGADLASVGSTIAVVGTGLDRVYPRVHLPLAHRIAKHGLMLSEFLLGTPPLPGNFPKRNRIVAGLTRGTLVVEAAVQSGSLITARLAGEMGREVLAIPGSIHSPQARGCHALIKQGAKLVETAQDVLDELHLDAVALPGPIGDAADGASEAPGHEDPILAVMGFDPVSQEALSARTGMGPADLGAKLLELELTGQVARLPGQLFQRMGQG